MTTTYEVADMMIGVRNMIEAADLRQRETLVVRVGPDPQAPAEQAHRECAFQEDSQRP